MQKTIISVVILGIVLVGGYFIIKNGKNADTSPVVSNDTNANEETPAPAGKKMAFSEFIKQGGTYKCEVKQAMNDFESTGTIYINGNGENMKTRGEWNTVAEGQKINTSFIMRDGYYYTWSDNIPNMNFKMKVKDNSEANTNPQNYSWDASQIGDYNCEAWTVDESKFTIPTNITFKTTGI